ncbi:MAG TPA: glycosyltransferase family 4 protein [Candidatus Moranbacteria bacterium]|nr:glycosyltransferase family 4 protein [Candidatus Moranbacteria bacterium]
MKILAIAPTSFFSDRGSHIRIYQEAKYLQKLGHEVSVFCYGLGKEMPEIKTERISPNKWYTKVSPGFSWGKIYLDLEMAWRGIFLIKNKKPDVIHAHLFEGLGVAWLARLGAWIFSGFRLKKPPILLDLQGDLRDEFESYNQEKTFAKKIFVNLSYWLVRVADAAVVSGENSLEVLRVKYPKTKFALVRDGVDLDFFAQEKLLNKDSDSEGDLELKKIASWKGLDRLLIYTGGMEKGKGVDWLLDTFISQKPDGWKLLLFGGGREKEEYQKKITGRDEIYFAKDNSYLALAQYLVLADVAIEPKRDSTESSGKLLNYMAAGLPIVCFDNNFNQARLGEKGNYLKDGSGFKDVLEDLQIGKINYDLAELSVEGEVQKLDEILRELVNASN